MIKIIGNNPQIEAMFAGSAAGKKEKDYCIFCEKTPQALEHGAGKQEAFKRFRSRKTFRLSPSMFMEARNYFHDNAGCREEIAQVVDSEGKTIAYLYWVHNYLRDNDLYQAMPAIDFWGYYFKSGNVNDFVLNWARSYLFCKLEEYTYAIARYILDKFPDRPIYFADDMAGLDIWGAEKNRVKIVKSYCDLPSSSRENCMVITTSEYNAYSDHVPESKNLVYNSLNIMYSMLWGSHIYHPGTKHPDKVVVRIDNKFASVGLGDIIKITMNFAYQAEMQGYVPVADLSRPGCCQYWEQGINVWEELFKPLSDIRPEETEECANLISARKEERGWLVSDWRSNPLWREADYQALNSGWWGDRPHLSDKAWDFVLSHAPAQLKKRLETAVSNESKEKDNVPSGADDMRILGVIIRGTDYRKEAYKGNARNENNADIEYVLNWSKYLMDSGRYDYLFLATEDEDYFRRFKSEFTEEKLLYVDQPRVHLDLSQNRRITTDTLFREKKVAGLDLAKLYLTVLKSLAVCDDLISSMDNGTYRQALRWNKGKFGLAKIIREKESLPLPLRDKTQAPQGQSQKMQPKVQEIKVVHVSDTNDVLSRDRSRVIWTEGDLSHFRRQDLLRSGDFFVTEKGEDQGRFFHEMPVCSPEVLKNMDERPLVLLLVKDAEKPIKKLHSYGYVEGEDFLLWDSKAEGWCSAANASNTATGASVQQPKAVPQSNSKPYAEYLSRYGQVTELDRLDMARDITSFADAPLISIVMPVHSPREDFFRQALDSVLAQAYPHWELCLAMENSSEVAVGGLLEEYRQKDARIKVATGSVDALNMVSGKFTVMMGQEDILQPEALYCLAKDINASKGEVDMLYTDMDYIDGAGQRSNPRFGPDFDPISLASWNNAEHLAAFRTSVMKELGGEDDLVRRFVQQIKPERIHHIPRVCYSWRRLEEEAASTEGRLEMVQGQQLTKPELPAPAPMVSIIIPTKDKVKILRDCVESIISVTDYPAYEIIIVDNRSEEQATFDYFKILEKRDNVRVFPYEKPFNHSAICNFGVEKSKGSLYLFLNNDTKMMEPGWLTSMVREIGREKVGVVGAKLLYANGKVQHGGISLMGVRIAHHPGLGLERNQAGYRNLVNMTRQCSAVTGACLLMRKETFDDVSGWDAENVPESYNDVDLCLRVWEAGWKVVYDGKAVLYHLESLSRGHSWNKPKDLARQAMERHARHIMIERHGELLFHDHFYNPNLSWDRPDYSIAKFPAVGRPWRPWIEFVCPFDLGKALLGIQAAYQAHLAGRKVRVHVLETLMPWLSDFKLPFPVVPVPAVLIAEGKAEEKNAKVSGYVADRADSSGLVVDTGSERNFDGTCRLNFVEYLLCQLRMPIGEKLRPILPEARGLDEKTKEILKGKTALLCAESEHAQGEMSQITISKLQEVLHQEGFRVVQIGRKNAKRLDGFDDYLLMDGTAGFWRAAFEKAGMIVSADSWAGHLAAMMGRPQITVLVTDNARNYYGRDYFENEDGDSLVLEFDLGDENTVEEFCYSINSNDKA
ncbi:glycosyltransferase family 2 protein [Selenomonas sp. KH1T6]|uniref:glycosyltransferase family 2 protein n=1 Tax=Selenomonas sp. KH1T6 TaxID=3158784 RepID=UPI0008A72D87|nr:Glycosyltransferase, GT2 family [Selenomonas ruminantium]